VSKNTLDNDNAEDVILAALEIGNLPPVYIHGERFVKRSDVMKILDDIWRPSDED